MVTVGLALKSALYPFEKWLPGAYSNATPAVAAMLSSLVSKGYIFLLIKFYVRVIGFDVICDMGILDILFILGMAGVISPMTADATFFIDTGILIAISAIMLLFAFTKKKTDRIEGTICVLMYAAYTAYIIMRAFHIWIF